MITKSEVEALVLGMPGMEDVVKVVVKGKKRRTILLLSSIIERGMAVNGEAGNGLFETIPDDSRLEVQEFVDEILDIAGLADIKARMNSLNNKKG